MENDAMDDIELANIGTERPNIASTTASIRLVASPWCCYIRIVRWGTRSW